MSDEYSTRQKKNKLPPKAFLYLMNVALMCCYTLNIHPLSLSRSSTSILVNKHASNPAKNVLLTAGRPSPRAQRSPNPSNPLAPRQPPSLSGRGSSPSRVFRGLARSLGVTGFSGGERIVHPAPKLWPASLRRGQVCLCVAMGLRDGAHCSLKSNKNRKNIFIFCLSFFFFYPFFILWNHVK